MSGNDKHADNNRCAGARQEWAPGIAERLGRVIEDALAGGLKQGRLAEKLGVSQATISELAARKAKDIKGWMIAAVAGKLGESGHWLLTGDDRKYVLAGRAADADYRRGYADGLKTAQKALGAVRLPGPIGAPIAPIVAPEPDAASPAMPVKRFEGPPKGKGKKDRSA